MSEEFVLGMYCVLYVIPITGAELFFHFIWPRKSEKNYPRWVKATVRALLISPVNIGSGYYGFIVPLWTGILVYASDIPYISGRAISAGIAIAIVVILIFLRLSDPRSEAERSASRKTLASRMLAAPAWAQAIWIALIVATGTVIAALLSRLAQ